MAQFQPRQILCPIDLSPASAAVLSWARLFAEAFGATRVDILHGVWSEPPRYFTEGQVASFAAEAERAGEKLRSEIECLADRVLAGKVAYRVALVPGHAVEVLSRSMKDQSPDLVVMGSHGHSRVARLLMGSVAENIVREAACPTLIVKGPELPPSQKTLQRVLCPVNFTQLAAECASVSSAVASALGAELEVVQAVEEHDAPDNHARERLCQWVPEGARRRCRVSEQVLHGDAAEQIVLFARNQAVDLIVLGAERRKFLEFSVLGRTTERVMRHSPCPVLVVPRQRPQN